MKFLGLLFVLSFLLKTEGSEILFIAPLSTKSHFSFFTPLINALAERGHQLTVFKSYDINFHSNVTAVDSGISMDSLFPNTFENRKWATGMRLMNTMPVLCAQALVEFHSLKFTMKNYDLVMIEIFGNDCFFSEIDEEVPLVLVSPNTVFGYMNEMIGNIEFPSFVSMVGLNFNYPMSFWERFLNTIFIIPYYGYFIPKYMGRFLETCQEVGYCKNMNEFSYMRASHASIAIINSVRALENPARPFVPSVVHAGGLHTKPAKSLPEDLKTWIEGAGEAGVIYFSLGTVVKISDLPDHHRKTLLAVFKSMSQRILWKSDVETIDDLPPNVRLSKWLPQQDVLGHPNVRLFITHGGLFSITEAIYHEVPILGFPVFADQESNMLYAVHDGIGESIEWDDLTEEFLKQKLSNLLQDKKYKDAIRHRSQLMKDQPMSPQETVVYWTEYVIRHKGAKHLRSPTIDMTWVEVYNMDVWAMALAITVTSTGLVVLLMRCLLKFVARKCFGEKHEIQKERKKKLN